MDDALEPAHDVLWGQSQLGSPTSQCYPAAAAATRLSAAQATNTPMSAEFDGEWVVERLPPRRAVDAGTSSSENLLPPRPVTAVSIAPAAAPPAAHHSPRQLYDGVGHDGPLTPSFAAEFSSTTSDNPVYAARQLDAAVARLHLAAAPPPSAKLIKPVRASLARPSSKRTAALEAARGRVDRQRKTLVYALMAPDSPRAAQLLRPATALPRLTSSGYVATTLAPAPAPLTRRPDLGTFASMDPDSALAAAARPATSNAAVRPAVRARPPTSPRVLLAGGGTSPAVSPRAAPRTARPRLPVAAPPPPNTRFARASPRARPAAAAADHLHGLAAATDTAESSHDERRRSASSDDGFVARVTAAFVRFDANRSGRLDRKELPRALDSLGYPSSSAHTREALARYDADANRVLDVQEFLALARDLHERYAPPSVPALDPAAVGGGERSSLGRNASPGGTIQRAGLAVAGHSDRARLVATQATRALSPTKKGAAAGEDSPEAQRAATRVQAIHRGKSARRMVEGEFQLSRMATARRASTGMPLKGKRWATQGGLKGTKGLLKRAANVVQAKETSKDPSKKPGGKRVDMASVALLALETRRTVAALRGLRYFQELGDTQMSMMACGGKPKKLPRCTPHSPHT